jgi:hypothetical protein
VPIVTAQQNKNTPHNKTNTQKAIPNRQHNKNVTATEK